MYVCIMMVEVAETMFFDILKNIYFISFIFVFISLFNFFLLHFPPPPDTYRLFCDVKKAFDTRWFLHY